jgi:hypothetical protein
VTGMAFFALVQFAEWLATPWHIAQRTTRSR